MPYLKAVLWRLVYAVILVVVLAFVIPLLLQLLGVSLPMLAGPAITLLKFALAALVIIYVFFGPDPPALF